MNSLEDDRRRRDDWSMSGRNTRLERDGQPHRLVLQCRSGGRQSTPRRAAVKQRLQVPAGAGFSMPQVGRAACPRQLKRAEGKVMGGTHVHDRPPMSARTPSAESAESVAGTGWSVTARHAIRLSIRVDGQSSTRQARPTIGPQPDAPPPCPRFAWMRSPVPHLVLAIATDSRLTEPRTAHRTFEHGQESSAAVRFCL